MIIDLHTHTSSGSRCGYQTPDELIVRAKRVGLDGICLTEHDWVWPEAEVAAMAKAHDFLVIGGAEVSTDHGDILVYGIHEPLRDVFRIEHLRDIVDGKGGVMVAAHPFRGMLANGLTLPEAVEWPVFRWCHGIEVFNGRAFGREADFACNAAGQLQMLGCGGSDAHTTDFVGDAVTVFERTIGDEAEFIAELGAGRCQAHHRVLGRMFSPQAGIIAK